MDKIPKDISHLISRFERDMKNRMDLGEDDGLAFDRCHEVSSVFWGYCCGAGVDAFMLHLTGIKGLDLPGFVAHWIVWLPKHELGIDWTARQFWEESAHPMIIRGRQDLQRLWGYAGWPQHLEGKSHVRTRAS